MTNNSLTKLSTLAYCFYYSTDLPICIFENDKLEISLPNNISSAQTILNKNSLAPLSNKLHGIELVLNIVKEAYFILKLDYYTINVGPFLLENMKGGVLTNMIRNGLIPFHQKSAMNLHFQNCKVLDENKLFYINKLLENMFLVDEKDRFFTINEKEENIDSGSFQINNNTLQKHFFLHSPYAFEQEICKTISNGDIDRAKKLLRQINLVPHAKLAPSTLRSYKNSMICSCAFMTRAAIAGGVNPDKAFSLSDIYINEIERIQDLKELQAIESTMAEGFSKMVQDIKKTAYSKAVLNTIYYIDNHLCEDIKIEELAKEVYLNSSYLSSLFHKETGFTISEWILNKRIEEAAFLVLHEKSNIADIAFFYHFSSQSYFVQCFKKVMGMTPGEYRKKAGS